MASSTATVTTRIFCISDTHQGEPRHNAFSLTGGSFHPPFPENIDILLHSGDLTMYGHISEYEETLEMLASIPAELKLVIAGNHDLSLHESYFLGDKNKHGELHVKQILSDEEYDPMDAQRAASLMSGPAAQKAGVTYLTEGLYTFDLRNGARFTIYVSPWQPEFYNWAFNYPRNEDRWNPPDMVAPDATPAPPERDPHPIHAGAHVDLMMTHGPPHVHLDKCYGSGHRAGCPHLLRALDRVRPRLHCFGHIHEGWGAERVTWKKGEVQSDGNAGTVGETTDTLGGRNGAGMGVTRDRTDVIRADDSKVINEHAASIDVSAGSAKPLRFGEETLLLNACVVNLAYKTVNAGWLVNLELPSKRSSVI